MNPKIKIMIIGYGNVGRGVRNALVKNPDMELSGIITRNLERVKKEVTDAPIFSIDDEKKWLSRSSDEVAILCGGSKEDLPKQGPYFAKFFNTVDSFDTHADIPLYFTRMDNTAKQSGKLAIISTGWDPGVFSLERVLADAFFPNAGAYAFYGLTEQGGLSMGHSDAIRQIKGVKDARQYTHAIPEAVEKIRSGSHSEFKTGDLHWRECFVVAEEETDLDDLSEKIKRMPNYFEPYRTEVHFVSQKELDAHHARVPHNGMVISVSETGEGNRTSIEYRCDWNSNPEATAHILITHARAAYRMYKEGKRGALTILDIPPAYLSARSGEELRRCFM